jgi:hypothetical protein
MRADGQIKKAIELLERVVAVRSEGLKRIILNR